jgi:hypothetical protein
LKDLKTLVGWESSSLVRLVSLSEQGVFESLMKMKSLFGQVVQPLVGLYVEEQGYPQDDLSVFLQPTIGGKGQFLKASCHREGLVKAALKGILWDLAAMNS